MKKKIKLLRRGEISVNIRMIALFAIFLALSPIYSIEAKKPLYPEEPVLITPLGQNPDGLMIKVVLNKIGIKNDYLELASSEDLIHNYRSVVMAVGVSYKGLGATGINFNDEIARAKKLVCEALKKDCPIIFVYFGENPGREKRTNQLIKLIAPYSSYMIIKEDANQDKYFVETAQGNKIPLVVVANLAQLEIIFKNIYYEKK
jgi:hypothetical protein